MRNTKWNLIMGIAVGATAFALGALKDSFLKDDKYIEARIKGNEELEQELREEDNNEDLDDSIIIDDEDISIDL